MIGAVPSRVRGRQVELEAPTSHTHLVPVLEARERGLEAPLSDVAPRAGKIRPDLDVHGLIEASGGRQTARRAGLAACTRVSVSTIQLNDGHTILQLGFGVFQIDPAETARAVAEALDVGYRHIDTAEMYGNEKGVGEAIRASGLDRGEIFVTSKLNNGFHRPDAARRAFDGTLSELGFDYVDLFLIHWPLPTLYDGDYVSTWKTLEEFQRQGRARSIGVSNFEVEHLERLAAECDVVPR